MRALHNCSATVMHSVVAAWRGAHPSCALCGTLLVQATTPLDPRVVDKMLPFMTEQYGNPHSRTHLYGWEAEDAVEVARAQVCAGKANLTLPATLPHHQLPACVALQCLS